MIVFEIKLDVRIEGEAEVRICNREEVQTLIRKKNYKRLVVMTTSRM